MCALIDTNVVLDLIVTSDLRDFANSPIRAVSPAQFVEELA
jgi:hypothetical protein